MRSGFILGALLLLNAAVAVAAWALSVGEPEPSLPARPHSNAPLKALATAHQLSKEQALGLRLFSAQGAAPVAEAAPANEPAAPLPTLVGIAGVNGRTGALLAVPGEPRNRLLFPGQNWMGWQMQRVSGKKVWLSRDGQVQVLDVTTQWNAK